ncbi:MAG: TonB-dependent receptor [Rhizomicrobium sp.]|jgi:iron complex outermembrane receptor protein
MYRKIAIRAMSATALACVLAVPALADTSQSAPSESPAKVKPAQQTGIEEVVVTARRRPEDLEKIPVAVTALSGDTIRTQEIKAATDLQNFAPSLSVTGTLGSRDNDVFSIRGQSQPFGGADPGVQTYFAEVPFNASGPGSYYDMANIQVLNGPQGTLFGRSTTGGAVLFEPQRPTDQFGGYAETQLGDYDLREFDGALNIPVVGDTLMVRAAFDVENRNGFTQDTVITGTGLPYTEEQDNVDFQAFRLGVTWRPFSHFENYTVFDFLHDSDNGTGAVLTGISPSTIGNLAAAYTGAPCTVPPTSLICGEVEGFQAAMAATLAAQQAAGPRSTTSSIPVFYRRQSWGVTDIATYDVTPHIHLKNIFGYRSDKEQPSFDYDGSYLPLIDVSNPRTWETNGVQITDELQLFGETDDNKFNWITGFYHELDRSGGYSEIQEDEFGGAGYFPPFSTTDVESLFNGGISDAGYGSATYNASDWLPGLSFTAGGRYTWDHKVATAVDCSLPAEGTSCPYPLPNVFPYGQPTQTANFRAPTWNLSVQDQVNDDTMVYATYRRGYKSGGFNSGAFNATDFEEFKPEYLTDIELGTKNNWTILGVPGRTNFDVYYGWYQDVQKNDLVDVEQQVAFLPPPAVPPYYVSEGFSALTFNAARATIKGLEFQSTFIPDDNFQVDVFYSYTDATYSSFTLPQAILVGLTGTQTEYNPSNLAGSPFADTPKNKFGMTPRFHIPIDPSLGMPYVSATAYWQSKEYFSDLGSQEIAEVGQSPVQKDYAVFNFRIDWDNFLGHPFDASLFVDNAFNRTYAVGADALLNLTGTSATIYAPPRMWGVELRYRFGADANTPQ